MSSSSNVSDQDLFVLPSSWAWVRLGDLNPEFQNGLSSRGEAAGLPTVVLRLADVSNGKISLLNTRSLPITEASRSKYSATDTDLLVIRVNGSTDLVGQFITCKTHGIVYCDHFIRMRVQSEMISHKYLALLGLSAPIRQQIEQSLVSTAGQKTVNQRHISSLFLPMAPRPEQDRIVAAIEEQFSRLDAGTTALEQARQKLAQLRAATLWAAINGRLVAGSADEPSLANDLDPRAIMQSSHANLPPNWVTTTISGIAHVTSGATPLRGKKEYWTSGSIPWITSAMVNNETISSAREYITPMALKETSVKLMPAGTLLVAMYGEGQTRGRCSELLIEATTNQACAAIVLDEHWEFVKPFLKLVLMASYETNRRLASGGVQPNLSVGIIKGLPVPLPPKNEQRRICEAVAAQLLLIDQLDTILRRELKRGRNLRASIFASAFSGKLVPQDAADEPASILLERITAERAASSDRKAVQTRARRPRTLRKKATA